MKLGPATHALVTGTTGLLGNNLARMLLGRGVAVTGLLREGSDDRPLADLDLTTVRGDIRDPRAVAKAAANSDIVFHAAAMVRIGRGDWDRFRAINVGGTRNVVAAVRRTGARLVHVSTADTVGTGTADDPADEDTPFDRSIRIPYMVTKYEAEGAVLAAVAEGLDAVIVNPGFLLGPWDWKPSSGAMLAAVGRGLGWFAPRGCGSFVDVRDVASAILTAAERGEAGRRYLLTGETLSYLEAWRLFAEVTGRRPPIGRLGPVAARFAGWLGDFGGWITGCELPVNSGALEIADRARNYSAARAEAELGFRRRPLRTTVVDAWDWMRNRSARVAPRV